MRQRHRARAGSQRRLPLGGRELARGPRAERAQRLRHRSQRAEVGAGARRRPRRRGSRSPSIGVGQVPHRVGDRHPVRDVVAADHDDRDVGAVRRRQRRELRRQHRCSRSPTTGRPSAAAPTAAAAGRSRVASRPPSVCFGRSAPSPAAIESPRTSRSTGLAVLLLPVPGPRRAPARRAACRSRAARCAAWRCSSSRAPYAAPPAMPPSDGERRRPVRVRCLVPRHPSTTPDLDGARNRGRRTARTATRTVGPRTHDRPDRARATLEPMDPAPTVTRPPARCAPPSSPGCAASSPLAAEGLLDPDQADRDLRPLPRAADRHRRFSLGRVAALPRRRLRRRRPDLAGRRQPRPALPRCVRFVAVAAIWLAFLVGGEVLARRRAVAARCVGARPAARRARVRRGDLPGGPVPPGARPTNRAWSGSGPPAPSSTRTPSAPPCRSSSASPPARRGSSGSRCWDDAERPVRSSCSLGAAARRWPPPSPSLHDRRLDGFAGPGARSARCWRWPRCSSAALPFIGADDFAWTPWLVGGARRRRARRRRGRCSWPVAHARLEPLGAVVVLVVAPCWCCGTTGADTTDGATRRRLGARRRPRRGVRRPRGRRSPPSAPLRDNRPLTCAGHGRAGRLHDLPELRGLRPDHPGRLAVRGAGHWSSWAPASCSTGPGASSPPPSTEPTPMKQPMNRSPWSPSPCQLALVAVGGRAPALGPRRRRRVPAAGRARSTRSTRSAGPTSTLDYPDLRRDCRRPPARRRRGGDVYVTLVEQDGVWAAGELHPRAARTTGPTWPATTATGRSGAASRAGSSRRTRPPRSRALLRDGADRHGQGRLPRQRRDRGPRPR